MLLKPSTLQGALTKTLVQTACCKLGSHPVTLLLVFCLFARVSVHGSGFNALVGDPHLGFKTSGVQGIDPNCYGLGISRTNIYSTYMSTGTSAP